VALAISTGCVGWYMNKHVNILTATSRTQIALTEGRTRGLDRKKRNGSLHRWKFFFCLQSRFGAHARTLPSHAQDAQMSYREWFGNIASYPKTHSLLNLTIT